jgi:hypothetical protein
MNITDYSEEEIKKLVQDGLCSVQALRDYKLLKDLQKGEKITHAAMDHNISRMQAYRIRKKYTPNG